MVKNIVNKDVIERSHVRFANAVSLFMVVAYGFVRWSHIASEGDAELLHNFFISISGVFVLVAITIPIIKNPEILALVVPGIMATGVFLSVFLARGHYMPYFFVILVSFSAVSSAYLNLKSFLKYILCENLIVFVFLVVFPRLYPGWAQPRNAALLTWVLTMCCELTIWVALKHVTNRQSSSNASMASFHTMLAATPNIVAHVDELNRVVYLSNELAKLANIKSVDYAIGRPLFDLFDAPDMAMVIAKVLKTEGNHVSTAKAIIEGEERHFKIICVQMEGEGKGRLIDITDITQIVITRDEAEKASKAKSDFLSRMSHEIRTPMNAILGMTELILRENLTEKVREQAVSIRHSGDYLLSIINDILDFSKIESGKMEIAHAPYQFHSTVDDVTNIIKMRMGNPKVHFAVYMDRNVPNSLTGDQVRVRQVLLNLLSNAMKYTREGFFALEITGEKSANDTFTLRIKVRDSGIGIKPEDMGKLFGEFVQFDTRKNLGVEGSGLGLAITRNLMRLMGGTIEVKSDYGKGTEFTVVLTQNCEGPAHVPQSHADKSVLLYCRTQIISEYLSRSFRNLQVSHRVATSPGEMRDALARSKWDYVFAEADLAYGVRDAAAEIGIAVSVVMLVDSYEASYEISDRQEYAMLTVPVYLTSIVNIFSGRGGINSPEVARLNQFTIPGSKILLVDDIWTNLKVGEGLLEPYRAEITTCSNGLEAVEAVRRTNFDIVFMDHMMPGMDGIEATGIIRKLGKHGEIPIVALTANAIVGAKEMFLDSGFNDFLSKPIDVAKLNEIMAKWIPKEKQKPMERPAIEARVEEPQERADFVIEGVDTAKGLLLSGGKIKSYVETLSVFRKDGTAKIGELASSLAADDMRLYTTHVHALKSACANIGAQSLSSEAAALEEAGKKSDTAFIAERNDEFTESLKRLLENIGRVVSENTARPSGEAVDMAALKTALSNLKKALETFDAQEVDKTSEELRRFTGAPEIGETLEEILQHAFVGKYRQALAGISRIGE